MATTRITHTRHGLGPHGLDYATKQGEPHNADLPSVTNRVLKLGCVNCSVLGFKEQMQAVWNANHTQKKHRVELYRITQSFSKNELDPNNPADVDKCNAIGKALAKKLYPDKMTAVATQADGVSHMLHNHIDVCSPGFIDGRALRGERTQQGYIAYHSDQICQQFGLAKPSTLPEIRPNQRRTKSAIKTNKVAQNNDSRGRNGSFMEQIQRKLVLLLTKSAVTDYESLEKAAAKDNLDVQVRRNKRGKVHGLSYVLKTPESTQKRPIRANRLGTMFQRDHIEELFEKNKEKQRLQRLKQQRLQSAAATQTQPNVAAEPKHNLNKKNSKTEKDKNHETDEPTF